MHVLVLLLSLELFTHSHAVGLPAHSQTKIVFNILSSIAISNIYSCFHFLFSVFPVFLRKIGLWLAPTMQGRVEKFLHSM